MVDTQDYLKREEEFFVDSECLGLRDSDESVVTTKTKSRECEYDIVSHLWAVDNDNEDNSQSLGSAGFSEDYVAPSLTSSKDRVGEVGNEEHWTASEKYTGVNGFDIPLPPSMPPPPPPADARTKTDG